MIPGVSFCWVGNVVVKKTFTNYHSGGQLIKSHFGRMWGKFNLPISLLTRHGLGRSAWALLLYGLCLLPAMGQAVSENASSSRDCQADKVIKFRGGTARLENDLFAGTDQNYTSGLAFTLVSHDITGKLQP